MFHTAHKSACLVSHVVSGFISTIVVTLALTSLFASCDLNAHNDANLEHVQHKLDPRTSPLRSSNPADDKSKQSKQSQGPKTEHSSTLKTEGEANTTERAQDARLEAILHGLSLEEKVGQLLFLGFGGKVYDETIRKFLERMQPGAIALFGRNIKTPKQTKTFIQDIKSKTRMKVPMFIGVDQEGGKVERIKKEIVRIPSTRSLGDARNTEQTQAYARELAEGLRNYGFNMNLAPVLDVVEAGSVSAIGNRSFGTKQKVISHGRVFLEEHRQTGILAVGKHFPGHGAAKVDSHEELPKIMLPENVFREQHLSVFQQLISEHKLDMLMTAHLDIPSLTKEAGTPATLSNRVLTQILRNEFGFQGVIVTDGLEMAAIDSNYGSGEAAVKAVNAGADMVMALWFPKKKNEIRRALIQAVRQGRISKKRLEQSVLRILKLKADYQLLKID